MAEDKYAWLEDVQDPKVVEWALGQDRAARRAVKAASDRLYRRMTRYYRLPIVRSVQATADGLIFFYSDSKSYKVELISPDGARKEVADSAKLGKGAVILDVQARKSGGQAALHYSIGGSDKGTVLLVDLKSHKTLDRLEGYTGDVEWRGDGSYYYVRIYRDEKTPDGVSPPASRVYLREGAAEEMVFGAGLPTNTFVGLKASSDGTKALLDVSYGWTRSRPYVGDFKRHETWSPIYPETDSMVQTVDYAGGRYYLLTFERGRGEVISTEGSGRHVVVQEAVWPIQDAVMVGERILCHYLVNARSELRLYGNTGREETSLKFDVPGSLIGVPALSAFGGEAAFAFSSFAVPYRVYRMRGDRLDTVLSEAVPGSYAVKDGKALSSDGTEVHYFTVSKKGVPARKVLLHGYGGFRVSLTPAFSPTLIPFLDDGGTYAVANLRGGLERGEEWHHAGMRERKPSVFEDYVAVAEKLRSEGAKVVGIGRSNGGLLMGAALNMRSDLFAGIVIGYPVLDMMAFQRLYVGRAWVPEYGDPEVSSDAEFLLKYSPYQNLRPRARHPPVFVYTGLKDDRVHPAHAFKFYAKLKEGPTKAWLRVETESGHVGTTPESRIREEADKMAFVYKELALKR